MPELPEVETIARRLRPELVGKSITKADLLWSRTLAKPTPVRFKKQVKGQEIKAVHRRAKYFVIQLSHYHLFIHLRMSGDLYIKEADAVPEKHDRLILTISASDAGMSKLVFNDTRKFGRVWLVRDPDEVIGGLGPEPLSDEFTAQTLYEGLQARHRPFSDSLQSYQNQNPCRAAIQGACASLCSAPVLPFHQ